MTLRVFPLGKMNADIVFGVLCLVFVRWRGIQVASCGLRVAGYGMRDSKLSDAE